MEVLSGERDPTQHGKGLFGLVGFGLVLLEKVELYAVETVKSGRTLGPDGFGFYAWLRNALPDATSTQDGFDEGLRNALPYDTSTQNTEDINIKKGEQFFLFYFIKKGSDFFLFYWKTEPFFIKKTEQTQGRSTGQEKRTRKEKKRKKNWVKVEEKVGKKMVFKKKKRKNGNFFWKQVEKGLKSVRKWRERWVM